MSKKLATTVFIGVLTLSAFVLASPVSAQWMVNGTNLAPGETKALASGAPVDENALLKAGGVAISCTGKNLEFGSAQIEAGDTGSANTLVFTECSANAKCTVGKTLATLPLMNVASLGAAPADTISFLPKTKTIFAVIKMDGAECALLGTQAVTGKAKFSAPTGQTEKLLQQIQANVTEASSELKVGSSPAELKVAALVKLTSDLPWSFL